VHPRDMNFSTVQMLIQCTKMILIIIIILYVKMNVCLYVCLFVCMYVCLFVCLYFIQIHISEPIGTKLCTRFPVGLEETVGYV
jgi:hypothetical protein